MTVICFLSFQHKCGISGKQHTLCVELQENNNSYWTVPVFHLLSCERSRDFCSCRDAVTKSFERQLKLKKLPAVHYDFSSGCCSPNSWTAGTDLMGVPYIIKLVQALTVFQLNKLNFSRSLLGCSYNPSVFSFWNWGLHLSEGQSNNFPLKFNLQWGLWDRLLHPLSWMGTFCLKAVWFWLFCCWEQPEISLTNTEAEGAENNWDFCISFGLCPVLLLFYTQVSHVHALRNSAVGPL